MAYINDNLTNIKTVEVTLDNTQGIVVNNCKDIISVAYLYNNERWVLGTGNVIWSVYITSPYSLKWWTDDSSKIGQKFRVTYRSR